VQAYKLKLTQPSLPLINNRAASERHGPVPQTQTQQHELPVTDGHLMEAFARLSAQRKIDGIDQGEVGWKTDLVFRIGRH
jgi:hypothetical protein